MFRLLFSRVCSNQNAFSIAKTYSYLPMQTFKKSSLLIKKTFQFNTVSIPYRGFSYSAGGSPHHRRAVEKSKNLAMYLIGTMLLMVGATYASAPLYKVLCQSIGLGGEIDTRNRDKGDYIEQMNPIRDRPVTVKFTADVNSRCVWNFIPQQTEITVLPGETALAFYSAENPTDKPVVGISTYNISPFEAAPYFNKIQCFCFEEQWLSPHEVVDLPVFFFIDPAFDEDPSLARIDEIVLSYCFFEANEDLILPDANAQSEAEYNKRSN